MTQKVKYKQGYCGWCGRYQYLMPGLTICAACTEDDDYLAVQANNKAVERRLKARKFVRTHSPETEDV